MFEHRHEFRVRYSDTDQMGTYGNHRALDWFEHGRTELSRAMGLPYAEWEARGLFLPVVEAHLKLHSGARYDDLLAVTTSAELVGAVRIQFHSRIEFAESGKPVASGWTLHALIDKTTGKPTKAPDWVRAALADED